MLCPLQRAWARATRRRLRKAMAPPTVTGPGQQEKRSRHAVRRETLCRQVTPRDREFCETPAPGEDVVLEKLDADAKEAQKPPHQPGC